MRVRRLVGGVLLLAVAAAAVLVGEAFAAMHRTYDDPADAPPVSGHFGAGPALHLVMLGDSTAVSLGASRTSATVGGRLAAALARDGRAVTLSSVAVSGARTADLAGQLGAALADRPDVAVVLIGANDATHLTRLGDVRSGLQDAVRRLEDAGTQVVVGTCPDLGAARAFQQPLRAVAAWRGRAVAAAEDEAVRAARGTPVPLAALTGPAFRADPGNLSGDEFHPSDRGYALWADALLPAVRAAAGRQ